MFRKTTYLVINALNLDIKRFLQHEIIIKKLNAYIIILWRISLIYRVNNLF